MNLHPTAPAGRSSALVVLAVTAALALAGCGSDHDEASGRSSASSGTPTSPPSASAATSTPAGAGTSGAPGPAAASSAPPSGAASTAPSVGVTTRPPVTRGSDAPFGNGLVAVVTAVDAVQLSASGPGEVAGPGAAVHLTLRNGTPSPVDLGGVTVNASYRSGTPADASDAAPSAPATGVLQPGATASGVWVFAVPHDDLSSLEVQVGSTSSAAVVVIRS